ncbi:hypothetical protein AVEN_231752-1 [Araneus ventricosus]|uniref:Uncharacterized protein n=1 Tax=Araneus ventricosus TaxID=182803 RepID=A0A4Y2RTJ3_ARAVE|nr:hypothetical protein AVEN_59448-1 [Araneus ventricosus]GBN79088.1 hypothetical protein AVEN_231752-1 [Araneus ventricosus]
MSWYPAFKLPCHTSGRTFDPYEFKKRQASIRSGSSVESCFEPLYPPFHRQLQFQECLFPNSVRSEARTTSEQLLTLQTATPLQYDDA